MTAVQLSKFLCQLRSVLATREMEKLGDADLWKRYVGDRDGVAFAALVGRHGPMVLGVCRRILQNEQDIEDAFQATFLVLVRRAASLRSPRTLANWLHGVARRTALEARRAAAQRQAKEAAVLPRLVLSDDPCDDIRAAVDEELRRLAEKYRTAVVLCDLEGKTRKEVARQLGWAEGTVASRLARGRNILAKRLARRGFGGIALAALLGEGTAPACVPSTLVSLTVKAASFAAARGAAGKGVLSSTVAMLTEGVLKSMFLTKLKSAVTVLMVSSVVTLSASAVISGIRATEPAGGLVDGQERGPANQEQLGEQLAELNEQLQQMQKKVVLLKQAAVQLQALQRIPPKAFDAFLANRFPYQIPFEIGSTENHEGGRLDILEVWGTRSRIEVGGQYLVRGKYVLPPGERGKLYFGERAVGDWAGEVQVSPTGRLITKGTRASLDLQSITVDKERGEFVLLHGMEGDGYFNLRITAAERYSRTFAIVFFGTGDNVFREKP